MDFLQSSRQQRPFVVHGLHKEDIFWHDFKSTQFFRESSNISAVAFSPVKPYQLAACTSFKLQLFDPTPFQLKREITRSKETIHCASYRNDGKLIVLGDSSGLIQIHDANSRSILRSFREHKGAIRSVSFLISKTEVASSSDDCTIKIWDIPGEKVKRTLCDHADSVRNVEALDDFLLCSSSYDGTIKLWDLRTPEKCVNTMYHGVPVEKAVFLSPTMIVSAGANYVKSWDLLTGGKELSSTSHHLKLISSLQYVKSRNQVLTGSLDKTIKVINPGTMELEASISCSSPVLSVALSADDMFMAIGMASGTLEIKSRTSRIPGGLDVQDHAAADIFPNTRAYFLRRGPRPRTDATATSLSERPPKIPLHDLYLKKFMFRKALDYVLEKGTIASIISVLEEIRAREAFAAAFTNRTAKEMLPICQFIMRHLTNPQYCNLLSGFCSRIVDTSFELMGQLSELDEIFLKLSSRISVELSLQVQASQLVGSLKLLLANCS